MSRKKKKDVRRLATAARATESKHSRRINHSCPICCVIPPYVLREVAKNGTPSQQEWAFQSLTLSDRIRGRRDIASLLPVLTPAGEKRRTIYDAQNGTTLPGQLVRGEGDPPTEDVAVTEAYDGSGSTYDLFSEVFGRNSIDDRGLRLDSTVHFERDYNNAFWDGSQMVYGDGDGEIFERFTKSIDVIGHELTHGVTQYEAALVYRNQPGALNESMSDVFGSLVKQWVLNQTAEEADWIIGEGLFTPNVNGVGLRSMKAPGTAYDDPLLGKDPQPGHMKDIYKGRQDSGGVHINSGIPNRAFYLAAVEIGGYAWEKAGQIWYTALRDRLKSQSKFADAAKITIAVAGELYGENGNEQNAVRNAWTTVGVIK